MDLVRSTYLPHFMREAWERAVESNAIAVGHGQKIEHIGISTYFEYYSAKSKLVSKLDDLPGIETGPPQAKS